MSRAIAIGALLAGASACTEEPRTYSTRSDDGEVIFADDFDRDELGPQWRSTTQTAGDQVRIDHGVLVLRDLQNHPLWLTRKLPDDLRIEFDAWATTEEGDIKVELGGDGHSFARSINYIATGYVVIFGGWNNTQNAIVRRNEHGRQKAVTSDPKVEPGRRYHMTLTRIGGEIRWDVDGNEILTFEDERPLGGEGHEHFAFSAWEAEVHFDNLVIEAI